MLKLLQTLCPLSGVSSREEAVRDVLRSLAEPYVDESRTDAFGNLILFKRGAVSAPHGVLLEAGMDETGVMVSGYTDSGCLRFQCVGGLDRRNLPGKRVYLGPDRVLGVFGMKPIHLSTREERKAVPKEKALYLDIGCTSRKEAEALVPLGTVGAFEWTCGPLGEGLFYGKALRSRTGCAVLLQLLREDLPVDVTAVFSAQREVGARGAFGSAFSQRPQLALTLDGCPADDLPGRDWPVTCALGKGPVLSRRCPRTALDRGLFELLRDCAQTEEIPWQVQGDTASQPSAGVYATRGAGCPTAALSLPVRYPQAPLGLVSLADCQGALHLTQAFLTRVAQQMERGVSQWIPNCCNNW